jgi:nucleolin
MADDPNNNSVSATTAKKKRLRKRKRKTTAAEEDDEPSTNGDNVASANTATLVVANDHEKSAQVNRTLYIEEFPFAAQPDQVRQCMLEHATFLHPTTDIVELRLPTWQDSGRLRGYGHVVLKSAELCTKVLSLFGCDGAQKMHLQNRYLTLRPAQAPKTTTVSRKALRNPAVSVLNPARRSSCTIWPMPLLKRILKQPCQNMVPYSLPVECASCGIRVPA